MFSSAYFLQGCLALILISTYKKQTTTTTNQTKTPAKPVSFIDAQIAGAMHDTRDGSRLWYKLNSFIPGLFGCSFTSEVMHASVQASVQS